VAQEFTPRLRPVGAFDDGRHALAREASSQPAPTIDPDEEARRVWKQEKRLDTRILEPWERYRALTDVYESCVDVTEMLDRKTRFALVIMGALNALNLLLASRPDVLLSSVGGSGGSAVGLRAYVALYATVSLYLFAQAISALRPRAAGPGAVVAGAAPSRLRLLGRVFDVDPDEYYERWSTAQIGQLSRETAEQVQVAAQVNVAKQQALDRVFKGLIGLTVLTAGLVLALAYLGLVS
jgi:hypothetical protein